MDWQFLDRSLQAFQDGFPTLERTALVMSPIGDYQSHLFAAEQARCRQMTRARALSFSTGRHCAHAALRAIDVTPVAIASKNRAPLWPDTVVGSITHSREIAACIAIIGSSEVAGVGIDIEQEGRIKAKLHRALFTDAERIQLEGYSFDAAALYFSAKEAAYKAIYPLGQKFIGFHEAVVQVQPARRQFTVAYQGSDAGCSAMSSGTGFWRFWAGHVLTVFVIPQTD